VKSEKWRKIINKEQEIAIGCCIPARFEGNKKWATEINVLKWSTLF
jgi:hypothetical protein